MPHQHAEPSQPAQQPQIQPNNQTGGQERLPAPASFAQPPRPTPPSSGASAMLMPNNLLYLQSTIGNRAVQRMLGARSVEQAAERSVDQTGQRMAQPQANPRANPLPIASKATNRAIQRKEED